MVKIPRELQSQNLGKDILGAARVHVPEACEKCASGKFDDYEKSKILAKTMKTSRRKCVLHIQ